MFCKNLKKNNIEVAHIVTTTPFVNDLIVSQVQNFRIDYILMKPFEMEELVDKLNFIVGFTSKQKKGNGLRVNLDEDEKKRLAKLELESEITEYSMRSVYPHISKAICTYEQLF